MYFGLSLPNHRGALRVRELADLAANAERAGCQSVWVSDHLLHRAADTADTADARHRETPPCHDPLTVLAAAAMTTDRMELGTSVLTLPWRHPLSLGKQIASLDDLAHGRVVLGVGVGMEEGEYRALGADFAQRGRIADESLQALRVLWEHEAATFRGQYFSFEGFELRPQPWQQPLPIVIGGHSRAALQRLARHGNGWHARDRSPREMEGGIGLLQHLCQAANRATDDLTIAVRLATAFTDQPTDQPPEECSVLRGTPDDIRNIIAAHGRAGVDEIIIDLASADPEESERLLDQFRAEGIL